MTNTSNLVENFESIVSALFDEAPSEKARAFVEKLAGQIRARGNDWIIANERTLHIEHNAEWHDQIAPVEDNRLWWLAEWQVALTK